MANLGIVFVWASLLATGQLVAVTHPSGLFQRNSTPDRNDNSSFSINVSPCPSVDALKPCACNKSTREIECGRDLFEPVTLQHIFQEASRDLLEINAQLEHGTHDFPHLTFRNSPLREITGNAFEKFTFMTISISRNRYLTRIEKEAFTTTANSTYLINLSHNPMLGSDETSVHDLFALLRTMCRVETIAIHSCGLTFVPSLALNSEPQLKYLRRLSILNNPLHTLQAEAFVGLPKIRFLLLSNNQINKIGTKAFKISSGQCEAKHIFNEIYYNIELKHNNLSSDSFEANTFVVDCSVELNLQYNYITYLREDVFKPLYEHINRIALLGNPIECRSCTNSWVLGSRYCPKDDFHLKFLQTIESRCSNWKLIDFVGHCEEFLAPLRTIELDIAHTSIAQQADLFMEKFPVALREIPGNLLPCPGSYNYNHGEASAILVSLSTILVIVHILSFLF